MKSMMDIFLLKLFLSFLVGSLWITSATIIAERLGTRIGGMIAGLPSTVVIALFFIGWTQTPTIAIQSTSIVPIVVGINALFIVAYIFLSRFNFLIGIVGSLLAWFVLSLGLVFLKFDDILYSLIGCVVLVIISYYILEKRLKIKSVGKKAFKYTIPQLLFRGILSGGIIAFAVIMTRVGGPLLGGAFSMFPALMLSTMIITHLAHGREFSAAILKATMISASITIPIYAIAVRYAYLHLDLLLATILSFVISLISGYFIYTFVSKRMT
jgi:hypothetical protein